MYFLASFLALLALGYASSSPAPCASPKAWTGRLFKVSRNSDFVISGMITYDEINQRVRLTEDTAKKFPDQDVGKKSACEYIILYKKSLIYRVSRDKNGTAQCSVHGFQQAFTPNQVPSDAKFEQQAYIGCSLPGSGLLVNTFTGEQLYQSEKVKYRLSVTVNGCIPVHYIAYGKELGVIRTTYYDIMLGTEPESFEPPADCKPGKALKSLPQFPANCADF